MRRALCVAVVYELCVATCSLNLWRGGHHMLFIIEGCWISFHYAMHATTGSHKEYTSLPQIYKRHSPSPPKHTQDTRHQSSPTASTTSHGPHDGVSTVSRMQKVHAPPIKQFRQHEASHIGQ